MQEKKFLKQIESIYIISFFTYLIFNSILPYTNLQPSIIRNCISVLFMLGGMFFIIYNIIFYRKNIIKNNYVYLLWIFIVVCILSSITMIKYGYIDNLKTIIWSCILFGVIYTYAINNEEKQIEKTIKITIIVLSIIWSIAILISLYQYIMQIQYFVKLENFPILKAQGFYYNRLFGIFVDPNFAAVTSVIILFSSIYAFNISDKKWKKVIWISNIILQFLYIILSKSRTGLVVFSVGVIIILWLKLKSYYYSKKNKSIFKIICSMIAVCILIIAIYVGTRSILEYIPGMFNKNIEIEKTDILSEQEEKVISEEDIIMPEQQEQVVSEEDTIMPEQQEQVVSEEDTIITEQENEDEKNKIVESAKVSLDRTDLDGKGVSNIRFELWRDCLEILKSKPLLGISPRNLIIYAEDCYPETYPAKGYDFGNGYLAIISGTGILGTIVVGIYLMLCAKDLGIYVIKSKYCNSTSQELEILAIGIIGMMLIAAFVNQEIFLVNAVNTAWFWLMLGYMMKKNNEKK